MPRLRPVRLSKIDDYLADNISCIRLSELKPAVNDKARWGSEHSVSRSLDGPAPGDNPM